MTHASPPRLSARTGSIPVSLALVIAGLVFATAVVANMLTRGMVRQVSYGIAAENLEGTALDALDETEHRLAMSDRPSGSVGEARVRLARCPRATRGGPGGSGPDVPAVSAAELLDHDTASWLLDGKGTLVFAPVGVAGALEAGSGIEVEPVQVHVVKRAAGFAADRARPARRVELPLGVTRVKTTWGVLVMTSLAKGPGAIRAFKRFKLFEVVEYVEGSRAPRRLAHIFPGSIGQVME